RKLRRSSAAAATSRARSWRRRIVQLRHPPPTQLCRVEGWELVLPHLNGGNDPRSDSSLGRHQCQGRKVGRPKGKGRPRLGSKIKGCCRPERDSMTANHVDHGIATFLG